jgi:hypothetical protein
MGYNDYHFTSPEPYESQSLEDYRNDVSFRQQLASAFTPIGPHSVRMETGHTLLPATHPDSFGPDDVKGPQVIIQHRNAGYPMSVPLGHDPSQWMPNLIRHLNSREVMQRMHEQMNGPYGDE